MATVAQEVRQHFEYLWSQQGNFRTLWNTAAQFVLPAWDNFLGEFAPGVNRNSRIFDSTGIMANERFAAAMEAMLTPRSQIWHRLAPGDTELEKDPAVQQWLDQVNKIMFAQRYRPQAGYASQTDECYMSLGAFGNNALFVDEHDRSTRYRSVPMSELVWAANHAGIVDTVFRKFKYTAKQACDHWGKDKLPIEVQNLYEKNPYAETEFLHCVRPNMEWMPESWGRGNKKFESVYLWMGNNGVIEHSGYKEFPYCIGRYRVAPREVYGRGPAIACLADIKTANEMVKTGLRAGQKAVDPPILLAEESLLTNFNQRPGANNYGMVSQDGKPLAIPFESRANFQVHQEMLEGTRQVVRDAFLNTLFQILVQNPNMTATEALLRAQEKGELIAPAMGRQQSEFLGPQIVRELQILSDNGHLPPPPRQLLMSRMPMRIEYTSPLARAMRAEEGSSIMNSISDLAQMANLDKTVLAVVDIHDAYREMAQIRGMPSKLIRSEEQVAEIMAHQQEAEQAREAAAQAPEIASGIQKLAQAASLSQGGGQTPGMPQPGAPGVQAAA